MMRNEIEQRKFLVWVQALCAQNLHREVIEDNGDKEIDCARTELWKKVHLSSEKKSKECMLTVYLTIYQQKKIDLRKKSRRIEETVKIDCR